MERTRQPASRRLRGKRRATGRAPVSFIVGRLARLSNGEGNWTLPGCRLVEFAGVSNFGCEAAIPVWRNAKVARFGASVCSQFGSTRLSPRAGRARNELGWGSYAAECVVVHHPRARLGGHLAPDLVACRCQGRRWCCAARRLRGWSSHQEQGMRVAQPKAERDALPFVTPLAWQASRQRARAR